MCSNVHETEKKDDREIDPLCDVTDRSLLVIKARRKARRGTSSKEDRSPSGRRSSSMELGVGRLVLGGGGGGGACGVLSWCKAGTAIKWRGGWQPRRRRRPRASAAKRAEGGTARMGVLEEGIGGSNAREVQSLVRLWREARTVERRMPTEPHWAFCYAQLAKVSRSFAFFIFQLGDDHLRDAICILYLVLRGLDTIEDDMTIADDIKIPALESFYLHFYENDWTFSCGEKDFKILMENFNLVKKAFLELNKSYQEFIVELAKIIGEGMSKYISKKVETMEEYNEYCYYVSGVVSVSLYKFFSLAGVQNLPPESVGISIGLFFQKMTIIRDYLEDINDWPRSRVYWPKVIWQKYADKLEDFKMEENSKKALHCLNELVNDALIHAKDCLLSVSYLQDPRVFVPIAIPQIVAFGMVALCYNNIQVFKGVVKLRRGLVARIFWETQTVSDVYNAFFEFSSMLRSKIDKDDPNAERTLAAVEDLQRFCRESGHLNERKFYIYEGNQPLLYNSKLVVMIFLLLAIVISGSLLNSSGI